MDCDTRTVRNWIKELKEEIGIEVPDSPFHYKIQSDE